MWCPAPINIFPKNPDNYVGVKNLSSDATEETPEKNQAATPESSPNQITKTRSNELQEPDNEDIKPDSAIENKTDKKINKNNIWFNLRHIDDDELQTSNEQENGHFLLKVDSTGDDFLKECQNLKNLITGHVKSESTGEKSETEKDRVIIKAKRKEHTTTEMQQKNLEENPESSTSTNKTEEIGDVLETSFEIVRKGSDELNNHDQIVSFSTKKDSVTPTEEESKIFTEIQSKEELQRLSLDTTDTENPTDDKESSGAGSDKVDLEVNEESKISTKMPAKEEFTSSSSDKINAEECSVESIKEICLVNREPCEADFDKVDSEANEETKNDVKIDSMVEQTCGEAKREIPKNVPVREEPQREFLLASSGKEG